MAIIVTKSIGSGRATCRLCKCRIEKGIETVKLYAYNVSAIIHRHEKDCINSRNEERHG